MDERYVGLHPSWYMPRKTADALERDEGMATRINNRAKQIYEANKSHYRPEVKFEKLERYWAGELAARELGDIVLDGHQYTYRAASNVLEQYIREIAEAHTGRIESLEGIRIAEIGCGTAQWSIEMAKKGASVDIYDISWNALQCALYRAEQDGVKDKFTIRQGDFFELHYTDETFDAVVSGGVIEHFSPKQQDQILQEKWRVLKPNGLIGETKPNMGSPLYQAYMESIDKSGQGGSEKDETFWQWLGQVVTKPLFQPLPMPYHKSGARRDFSAMMSDNGYHPLKRDSLGIAPSAPLLWSVVEKSETATAVFKTLEKVSAALTFDLGADPEVLFKAKALQWELVEKSLTDRERSDIAWWEYLVAKKRFS